MAAAAALGVVGIPEPKIADLNILRFDYGVKYFSHSQPKFLPLANAKDFWRNSFAPKLFIINDEAEAVILKRSGAKISQLAAVKLDNLPNRPRGTMKLKFEISFIRNDALKLTVEDFGFGELFPKTDYKRDFIINLD